jgi:hypothetical protein
VEQVIFWTVVLGTGIFGVGLISAISARRQHKQKPLREAAVIGHSPQTRDDRDSEMYMAASGTGRHLSASDGERALAGAGQGREH